MSDLTIRVEDLSKKYKIAALKDRHDTLRDQFMASLKSVFRGNGQSLADKNSIWALKNITFDVKKGEIIGLIGGNGSGKSTLLKVLSRITTPTEGRAQIFGSVGALLEVGTGFDGELNGRENIYLSGAILGMSKSEINRKFDEIVSFSEIEKFIDTPVKRYSSGMYVRLAFAVAAHLEPEILFIDEVLAVGDASFQKKCLGKMSDVAKEGRTVLFVSHNMVAVNSLCRRAIWLKDGQIIEDGPSLQVVPKYLSTSAQNNDLIEEVWENSNNAPGNDKVRLHRIRLLTQEGSPLDLLNMQTSFQIEVQYWNLLRDVHLHITIHVYTADGLIAFTTGSGSNGPRPAGLFRSTCYVPGNLLNSGRHRLDILVVKDFSTVIYHYESRVSFEILDLRERQGAWFGKEPGVVQPVLEWTTKNITKASDNIFQSIAGES